MTARIDQLRDIVKETGLGELNDFLEYGQRFIRTHIAEGERPEDLDNPFMAFLDDIELMDQYGGEGQGDQYWKVFRLDGKFYRFDGWHSSWDGVNFEDNEIYEVFPKEVVVIEYVRSNP